MVSAVMGVDYVEESQSQKEVTINAGFDTLEKGFSAQSLAIINGANVVSLADSRYGVLILTGALTLAATVQLDGSLNKATEVINLTTGNQTVQVKIGAAGTLRTVPPSGRIRIWPTGYENLTISGGGSSSGLLSARPTAAAAGNGALYLPTDGLTVQRSDGANWSAFGPLFPLTPPVAGSYAWHNQGAATFADNGDSIWLTAPANAAESMSVLEMNAPATPYKITAMFLPNNLAVNFHQWGLCWRDSTTNRLECFHFASVTSNPSGIEFGRRLMTSATVFNTTAFSVDPGSLQNLFIRIEDDGVNHKFSYSRDGKNFLTLGSAARASWLANAGDKVGFFVNTANATYPVGTSLIHWKQS